MNFLRQSHHPHYHQVEVIDSRRYHPVAVFSLYSLLLGCMLAEAAPTFPIVPGQYTSPI
ncbi:hypothetical protein LSH36_673g01023 [Paralvinella palmiformis]|uniref:Uncharacterized protein n=1 Tax=Paralvinella palmiformis TaxID=53620 RepID=A0AAD9J3A6_9ANNE|nr:hypothetical protein LSH36_673g01023 [Paralvinella palmiformis]